MRIRASGKEWRGAGVSVGVLHEDKYEGQRPSPADVRVGVDQLRNKILQFHACEKVQVFTVINPHHWKRPFSSDGLGEAFDRLRAR